MKAERTPEDRERIDSSTTKGKELKELAPDEARPIEKSERKRRGASNSRHKHPENKKRGVQRK